MVLINHRLGEATDHFAQSEVEQMDIALKDAEEQNKAAGRASGGSELSNMTGLLSQVPGAGGLAQEARDLQAQSNAQDQVVIHELEGEPSGPHTRLGGLPGNAGAPSANIPGTNLDPAKIASQIYPILVFRDKVVRLVSLTIEKIPGLEALVEKITDTINLFILSLLAPFIRPIIIAVSAQLKTGSSGVIGASGKHQYEPVSIVFLASPYLICRVFGFGPCSTIGHYSSHRFRIQSIHHSSNTKLCKADRGVIVDRSSVYRSYSFTAFQGSFLQHS